MTRTFAEAAKGAFAGKDSNRFCELALIEQRLGLIRHSRCGRDWRCAGCGAWRPGFLIADRPMEGIKRDIYIPAASARRAMHGDRILVKIARIEADGRADGEIVKVLQRTHPTVVGEFRIRRGGNFVAPHDERIHQWIEIPEGMEIPPGGPPIDRVGVEPIVISDVSDMDGLIVNVELLEYPAGDEPAVGRVIEILGRPDDFGVDVEIMIRKHHLPHRFPPDALDQAQDVPLIIAEPELEGRRDFRGMDIVTIDGETARDFDDAVFVERLDNANYRLHVHIADARYFLRSTSERYALITGEPPPPIMARVSSLYSEEYFSLVRDRLVPGGMVTYWLPMMNLDAPAARSLIRAFCNALSNCSLWNGAKENFVLAGSRGSVSRSDDDRFVAQWRDPIVASRRRRTSAPWSAIRAPSRRSAAPTCCVSTRPARSPRDASAWRASPTPPASCSPSSS